MAGEARTKEGRTDSLIERRVQHVVNARSATVGLAGTFVGLAVVGAILMRFADPHNFPSIGLAIWWALQTVTTVGYGDVVPTTDAGRIVGGVEMVIGVAFIAFVTAGVTSAVLQRGQAQEQEAERRRDEQNTQSVIDALAQTEDTLKELGDRLAGIESKLSA
ncbi:MAG TPA: potassium channel family protein [Gaiellaceae bacterium]|nr:potassium channel family protein [Gaiellaceae bacterium]